METLNDRIALLGGSKVAFVGLTRGAGKTTAIRHVISGLHERDVPFGVAAAGRRDSDLEAAGGPACLTLALPAGSVVATTAPVLAQSSAILETVERVDCSSSTGQVMVSRVREPGEVEVVGPGTGPDLRRTVEAIQRFIRGPILVEGSLARKGFSAPGVADHIILAVGAGLSPVLDRLIPAVRYYLDLFGLPLVPAAAAALYEKAQEESRCILTGQDWTPLDSFHWQVRDNAPSFLGRRDMKAANAIIPQSVTDELVIPLLRDEMGICLVVRDPMRNALSPVYHAAWEKRGGGVKVVHRPQVLALVANPVNPTGPDADPKELLETLQEGLGGVPVFDVVQEMQAAQPKKRWFGR